MTGSRLPVGGNDESGCALVICGKWTSTWSFVQGNHFPLFHPSRFSLGPVGNIFIFFLSFPSTQSNRKGGHLICSGAGPPFHFLFSTSRHSSSLICPTHSPNQWCATEYLTSAFSSSLSLAPSSWSPPHPHLYPHPSTRQRRHSTVARRTGMSSHRQWSPRRCRRLTRSCSFFSL